MKRHYLLDTGIAHKSTGASNSQRRPPRGYDERVRRYFESQD